MNEAKQHSGFKFTYGLALLAVLILSLLVMAFTPAPVVEPAQAQAADAPAYCTALPGLNIVNKYGRQIPVADGTNLYRVAGDRVNLFVEPAAGATEITPTVRVLLSNKQEIVYDRFGNFSADGYYSFYAAAGTYAVGYNLTQAQYDACGGAGAFEHVIEYGGNYFVISQYLIINVLAPTPQPRISTPHPVYS